MKTNLKFYIGERYNPQFNKPYYVSYGQLTKKEVVKKENCIYGSMSLTSYNTEEDYNNAIIKLKEEGFSVR